MKEYLEDFEKDQLLEMVNIGAGNASTALSQMVGKKVKLKVPDAIIDQVEKITPYLGDPGDLTTTVLLTMEGEAPGIMLLMFPPESALNLAGFLTKNHKKDIKVLDEMDRSALREVGNILTGNSITALAKFLGINIIQSVPEVVTDMLGSIINSIMAEIGMASDLVLVFKIDFSIEEKKINGRLFFIFDPDSTKKIIKITDAKLKT